MGIWRYLVPLFFMNSHAVIYETIEWLAAEAFGGELGEAYLGTQGDVFDAQKDMALAFLGTLLSADVRALAALTGDRGGARRLSGAHLR